MTITTTTGIFAPFNYLTQMALVIDIEKAIAGNQGVIATGIKIAGRNQPASLVLKELREMIHDNRVAMENMLGVELVKRIADGI